MNSANVPASEVNQAINDAQAILQSSGVTQSDVQLVVNNLKAIATELQTNVQNTKDKVQTKQNERTAPTKRPSKP